VAAIRLPNCAIRMPGATCGCTPAPACRRGPSLSDLSLAGRRETRSAPEPADGEWAIPIDIPHHVAVRRGLLSSNVRLAAQFAKAAIVAKSEPGTPLATEIEHRAVLFGILHTGLVVIRDARRRPPPSF